MKIVGFAWVFAGLTICCQAKYVPTDPAPFVGPALEAVRRMNKVCDKNGWQAPPDKLEFPVAFLKPDERRHGNNVGFGRFSVPIRFDFLPTGEVVSFTLQSAVKNAPLYDSHPKPGWSKAHAVEAAEELLVALLGTRPPDLGTVEADFFYPSRELKKFYDGEWSIMWPRVSNGLPYHDDCIRMTIGEKRGLVNFGDKRISWYRDSPVVLTEAKALELAPKYFDELVTWPPARQWLRGFTLKEAKAELLIVNPNHITSLASLDDTVFAKDRNARLRGF